MNFSPVNSILVSGTITFSHSSRKKNEASILVFDSDWTSVSVPQTSEFTRIGRQFHAVSANRYTAGIILLASLFAAGYRSRYRKIEFTALVVHTMNL